MHVIFVMMKFKDWISLVEKRVHSATREQQKLHGQKQMCTLEAVLDAEELLHRSKIDDSM